MEQRKQLKQRLYDPSRLLDMLIQTLGLNSDKALSRKLKVASSVISGIRQKRIPLGASVLMWMSEATGMSICELRELMGDRRAKFRLSYA